MEIQVFTIHDSKAEAFITPWFSQTVQTAQRQFMSAVSDESTDFFKYPGDYTLFHLGSFNQETAKFGLLPTPVSLGLAISYKRGRDAAGDDPEPALSEAKSLVQLREQKKMNEMKFHIKPPMPGGEGGWLDPDLESELEKELAK